MQSLLFLCTGNYYRRRHAPWLFNRLAAEARLPWRALPWRAESRGLAIERDVDNVVPMSRRAPSRLAERGVIVPDDVRYPLQVAEADFTVATRTIALCEQEHRPILLERFTAWADRVEYWTIEDVEFVSADLALPAIECEVERLVTELTRTDPP